MSPAKAAQKFADALTREILVNSKNATGRAGRAVISSSPAGPPHLGASLGTAASISQVVPGVTEPQNIFDLCFFFFFKLLLLKIVVFLITVQNHVGKRAGLFEWRDAFLGGGRHDPVQTRGAMGCRHSRLLLQGHGAGNKSLF